VQGYAAQRVVEKLDRAVSAIPAGEGKVHIGWRLLSGDPKDAGFNVYRRVAGEIQATRLTRELISQTTDFIDSKPPGVKCEYLVAAVVGGQEQPLSPASSVDPAAPFTSYIARKLDGSQTFQKLAIADLDGDGRYDYVIKTPNSNVDPYEKYCKRVSSYD